MQHRPKNRNQRAVGTRPKTLSNSSDSEPVERRNGNGARLPKALRDKLNQTLQDGLPYPDIIQNLGDDGKHLSTMNLSGDDAVAKVSGGLRKGMGRIARAQGPASQAHRKRNPRHRPEGR